LSDSNDDRVLRPTRIDIPAEVRLHLIQLLNQTLACATDLRSHVKQAFWNVKGRESSVLRMLFKAIASELEDYADLVADRIVVLGGLALVTAREAASHSSLLEYPSHITNGEAYIVALAERFAQYGRAVRSGISQAADVEDSVTVAIYTDILRGIDKQLSCLEAHLR